MAGLLGRLDVGPMYVVQCSGMLLMVSNELENTFLRDRTSFVASVVTGVAVVGCFRMALSC